jgi:citrate synthase
MTGTSTEQQNVGHLNVGDQTVSLPILVGTENEKALDISNLRRDTGFLTLDEGYRNTGSVRSAITYVDGERGVLRYRGIPIQELAEHSNFVETSLLLIYGELPTAERLARFRELLTEHAMIHEGMRHSFNGFPATGHPMAILSSMINTMSCYHSDVLEMEDDHTFETAAARLMSKVRTVAAAAYKTSIGQPIMYPDPRLSYCRNFLHMIFSLPTRTCQLDPDSVSALRLFLVLHADHEQNCSTSTVRMVASAGANLFASCAAGVCALWGPLHGGANTAVIQQLEQIRQSGLGIDVLLERVKMKEAKLFGFGHGVYKSYDPRADILRKHVDKMLSKLGRKDPLLDIARRLEEIALGDEYFIARKLYPNVDFYSGILLRALGIPTNMFTVMFAIGRLPGWIAHWKEVRDAGSRIFRPRQVYVGSPKRNYTPLERR